MAYPLAPWIGPPESITKSFATGLGIASDIANQRAKLDEDAASQQLWANLERQKQAQQAAYQQQGLAQDAQRLAMEQQAQEMKQREAQQQFESIQNYRTAIASGMDPVQAAFRNLPGSGDSLQGIGTLARQLQMSKNYAQPLPDPTTMLNPANQQKYGVYYTRGTEGEPEPSLFPTQTAKADPYELALYRDELKGYDDDIKRAADEVKKMDLDPAVQAAVAAEKPNPAAVATKRAYEKAKQDLADAIRARDVFRASRPFGNQPTTGVAPPGGAPPPGTPPPRAAAAAPGSGAQFTYDPASGKIVPRGQQAPAAEDQGGGMTNILGPLATGLGQAAIPTPLRPSFLASQARNATSQLISPNIRFPGSDALGSVKSALGEAERVGSQTVNALESALSGRGSHLVQIPNLVKQEMLDQLDDQQLYDLYVSLSGRQPALREGTRQELVDLIRKLKQQ